MKYLIALTLILGFHVTVFSQSYSDDFVRPKSRAVYLEVLGNGIGYSFNYDQRFQNRLDGLGFKVGGSYFALDGTSVATFPFGLNYLNLLLRIRINTRFLFLRDIVYFSIVPIEK